MIIKWQKTFDASHRIFKDYHGKCQNLHGHTYKVEIEIQGETDEKGMLVDFNILKKLVHDFYDHKVILHKDDPLAECLKKERQNLVLLSNNPTAENIAKQIAANIMGHTDVSYVKACVYETPSQCAIFTLKNREQVDIEWEEINFQ